MAQHFWLKVRKEYVMENFESLINYLKKYDYQTQPASRTRHNLHNPSTTDGNNNYNGSNQYSNEDNNNNGYTTPHYYGAYSEYNPNADYDDSLACMEEVADDIFSQVIATPVYKPLDLPYDLPTVLRLLTATVLASRKVGVTDYKNIIRIASLLGREDSSIATYRDIESIIVACIRRDRLNGFPLGWSDIAPDLPFMMGVFKEKFRRTTFHRPTENIKIPYLESKGMLLIPADGVPVLSMLNLEKYKADSRGSAAVQFFIPEMVKFTVSRKDYEKVQGFRNIYNLANTMLASQSSFTPSGRRTLRQYSRGEAIIVRITEKRGLSVKAETVDPAYERIEGKVNLKILNPPSRPYLSTLQGMLREGDYLRVNLSTTEGYTFDSDLEFEKFYREFAAECHNKTYTAIPVRRFPKGHIWLTEEGVQVAVHENAVSKLTDDAASDYEHALANGLPVYLTFYSERPATDGENFFLYAEVGTKDGIVLSDETCLQPDAYKFIFEEYLGVCQELGEEIDARRSDAAYTPIDSAEEVFALLSLLAGMVEAEIGDSSHRLQTIVMAEFVARMCSRDDDAMFMSLQRKYMSKAVSFAANEEVTPLSLPPQFTDLPICIEQKETIATLQSYRKKDPLAKSIYTRKPEDINTRQVVQKLVDSSNSLLDIIDDTELNHIKQLIAKALCVEDEYRTLLDTRTFYGMESINLEFKTSVVYPPVNPAKQQQSYPQPDVQKWNIIKTVCGFLNSRSGGDLLIGVNDAGYAVSLEDDMRELCRLNIISAPNLDQYRNYIQTMFDAAYCTDREGRLFNYHISHDNIRLEIETNEERANILRVKVTPAPEVVYITSYNRPADYKSSYVRENGRTIELSDSLRTKVEGYKRQ